MRERRSRFWVYAPFGWVAYPPLFVVFAATLAVLLGAGSGIGAPSLIWHDYPATQLLAGWAIAFLCVHLGVVGYLIDSRESPDEAVAPNEATLGTVARYLRWPVWIVLALVALGAVLQEKTRFHGALVLVGPAVACAFVTWLARGIHRDKPLMHLVPERYRPGVTRAVRRSHARLASDPARPPPDPGAHAVQMALMALLAVAYLAAWALERHVPAALAVSLTLSILTGVWGLLRFWFQHYRVFWSVVVVLAACGLGATRDVSVTGLAHVTFPQAGAPPRPLVDDAAALERWKAGLGQAKPPLVIVATSGGALRAGIWTLNVLGALEARIPGFLRHVRLITGASGGMVGAAHLVSALDERGPTGAKLDARWFDGLIEGAAKDSLTPITRALIFPFDDRGRALERSWERGTKGRLAMPFRALMRGEQEGWLPSLVYAPMLVEDGRRLFVSNLDLGAITWARRPWPTPGEPDLPSISSVQLFACAGDGIDDIKLSTVARLNATFPWVTSAALLTSDPDRRVVDAGYYDNYGVDIATQWMRKNAVWLEDNTSGVLLVQIRDGATYETDPRAEKGPGRVHARISFLTTPVEAFLAAREASMAFRNDQKVEALAGDPRFAPATRFFVTELFEFPGKAPLEWYLNRATIDGLKRPPPAAPLAAVEAWWRGVVTTP
ncbi:MAG TPA: hypothetical protein VGK52_04075 [Polyangia bacterium]